MNDPGRVVIVGAGPAGLGAAHRLQELGHDDFLLLEAGPRAGGLARSFADERGFTWDIGGHVQFSHYPYYDAVLDRALGDAWLYHEREAWVWTRGRFVPYPFQYNLHRLDPADRDRALAGLEQARDDPATAAHFGEWIDRTFGTGLAELFMRPYNLKVWGYPLDRLDVQWMRDRVAVPDPERVRENVRLDRDDRAWGPNRTFRFPLRGGTGAIWTAVAASIQPDRLRFDTQVASVDLHGKHVVTRDGERVPYDRLMSTMPLDGLCEVCDGLSAAATEAAGKLVHSSVHIVGIGLRGGKPADLQRKCWMYFPEADSPYYRVTVFSHYSPHNVPAGDGYWSLMAEICESPYRPVDAERLEADTLQALARDRLIDPDAERVSFWHRRESHGYPTPFLGRDGVLGAIESELEAHEVYSRGRFGAWRYEVSNQDHTFMQGVEVVNRWTGLGEEETLAG